MENNKLTTLQRLYNLQKEFKELYEEGDKGLIGVGCSDIQMTSKQFFLTFNEYDLEPLDSKYIEASAEHEGVRFITLIRTVAMEV